MKPKFIEVLPKGHSADLYIASVITTVAASVALQKCTAESIALAAYDAATLGLPVNKLGLAWLVPYGNEAKFQIGYRGYIQLVEEQGFVEDIVSECVYEKDFFQYELGTNPFIKHKPPEKVGTNRGEVVAAYAIAYLASGRVKHCVMERADIDHIRKKSKSANNGPWVTDYPEMAKKTVIKRLCKLLPYNIPGLAKVERASQIEEQHEIDYSRVPQLTSADIPTLPVEAPEPQPTQEVKTDTFIDIQPEPVVEAPPPNPLLGQLCDLQAELESVDPNCDRLPKGYDKFEDSQLRIWINKKKQAIKEATEKQQKVGK